MAREINGSSLRTVRELVGLSTRELAARAGCAYGTVTNLEIGLVGADRASPALQRKLADALGVKLDAITYPVPEAAPVPEGSAA